MNLKPIRETFLGVLSSLDSDCETREEDFSVTHPATYVALVALKTEIERQYKLVMADEAEAYRRGG